MRDTVGKEAVRYSRAREFPRKKQLIQYNIVRRSKPYICTSAGRADIHSLMFKLQVLYGVTLILFLDSIHLSLPSLSDLL